MAGATLERAQQSRAALKAAARRATFAWLESVVEGLESLVREVGATGSDPVVVFDGHVDLDAPVSDLDWEPQEKLCSALFATAGKRRELSPEAGPRWQWAEAVSLWTELREALALYYGVEAPVSLLFDVAGRVAYLFEPWYCPDLGPEPIAILKLSDVDATDPFTALLTAAEDTENTWSYERRLDDLVESHLVTRPTQPGHEPGDCALGGPDLGPDLGLDT